MQFLFVLFLALVVGSTIYFMGRKAGYKQGRIDEGKDWATKIREVDEKR